MYAALKLNHNSTYLLQISIKKTINFQVFNQDGFFAINKLDLINLLEDTLNALLENTVQEEDNIQLVAIACDISQKLRMKSCLSVVRCKRMPVLPKIHQTSIPISKGDQCIKRFKCNKNVKYGKVLIDQGGELSTIKRDVLP